MDRYNCLRKSAVFIFIVAYVIGGFTQSAPRFTTRHRSNLKCLRSAFVTMNTPRTVFPAADEVAKTFIRREIGAEVDIESSQILALRTNLLLWYRANRRLLPWRGDKIDLPDSSLQKPTTIKINDETIVQKKGQNSSTVTFEKSAYGTWISEIMLQQTRVETVIPYWLKWMARFPSIEVLASASGVPKSPILNNRAARNHDFRYRILPYATITKINKFNFGTYPLFQEMKLMRCGPDSDITGVRSSC